MVWLPPLRRKASRMCRSVSSARVGKAPSPWGPGRGQAGAEEDDVEGPGGQGLEGLGRRGSAGELRRRRLPRGEPRELQGRGVVVHRQDFHRGK